jgi:hypothetical protein
MWIKDVKERGYNQLGIELESAGDRLRRMWMKDSDAKERTRRYNQLGIELESANVGRFDSKKLQVMIEVDIKSKPRGRRYV